MRESWIRSAATRIGAFFWAALVACGSQHPGSLGQTNGTTTPDSVRAFRGYQRRRAGRRRREASGDAPSFDNSVRSSYPQSLPSRYLAALLGVIAALCGCSSSPRISDNGSSGGLTLDGGAASCALPHEGCPCTAGATADCGEVIQRSGTYTTCSMGTRTCENGSWGACIGQYVTAKALPSGGGGTIRLAALGASMACTNNPCDPACHTFVNDPSGLDAGVDSGITINDSGVLLTGVPVTQAACTSLQVTPSTAPTKDLVVTSLTPSPSTVQYTPSLLPAACYMGAPSVLWSIDKFDVAQISNSGLLTLAVPVAGPITVSAFAGTLSGSVVCNVTVNVVDISAAPMGYSNAQFPTVTGAADNIAVLYPYANTVFPLGLPSPLIQWANNNSPATAASAVKITLRFPATGTPIFTWSEIVPELQTAPTPTLAAQPRANIPQNAWDTFAQTVVRNSGAAGGDAQFAIQRYVSGALRAEVATTIHFANGQLKGNVFYQTYGTNLVKNSGNTKLGASFGAATLSVPVNGLTPKVIVGYDDPSKSGAGCRVCHNVSADGTQLITNSNLANGTSGAGTDTTTWTYDPTLGTPAAIQGSEMRVGTKFTFAAISPDGNYLFTNSAKPNPSNPSSLYLLNGSAIASNVPTTLKAAMPVFSPDAKHVAFMFQGGTASPLAGLTADGKTLSMMDFSAPSTFSNFRNLYTPTGVMAAWPSFLPAGENGIVFQNHLRNDGYGSNIAETRADCNGCTTGATANLWWVSTGSTPQAAPLTQLNGGSYLPRLVANKHGTSTNDPTYYEEVYNYEPTVLPVTVGGYSWVAFMSRRLYGNVATINPYMSDPRYFDISVTPTTEKIWIAALSTNPTPGTDPSFPAFYLPGQELLAGNSKAFLALSACEAAGPPSAANLCTSDLDCCGSQTTPGGTVCSTVAENQTAAIACPAGQVVSAVTFASFGTPTGVCGAYVASACNAATSKSVVAAACLGANTCQVPATDAAFGDPCVGTVKALDVQVTCSVPPAAHCQLDPPPLGNPPTSHCVSNSSASCVADGTVCTSDGQCCNFSTGSRCASGTCQPTPIPLLYSPAPFVTTYMGICPAGTSVVWRFFYWQSKTPAGTSIAFTAQTSPDGVTWGSSVAIGTSAPPPSVTSTWTSAPQTVDAALQAAGQVSRSQLKVTATLNSSSDRLSTPTLTNWQVQYSCGPSE